MVWWYDNRGFCCLVHTHTLRGALSSRQCDRRHAHATPSSVAHYPGSLCKAIVNKLDDEGEVDHNMRPDEKILHWLGLRKSLVWRCLRQWHLSSQLDNVTTLFTGSKLHRQFEHCPNRRLEDRLRRRGTHPTTLSSVKHFKCQACEEFKAPQTRNVVASYDARPDEVLEIDGTQWRNPVTGETCRGQIMVDVDPRCVMVRVFEETVRRLTSNNRTGECGNALIDGWIERHARSD